MQVMQVITHPAETCPVYESKYRGVTVNWYQKVESTANKYGIKFLGSWNDHPMHIVYALYDTPSMDTMMKFMMEPEMLAPLAFCKSRVFPVLDHNETLAHVKGGK